MDHTCKKCQHKDGELNALRSANSGLRATIQRMEAEKMASDAHVIAQYATYDQSLANLRREVSTKMAIRAEEMLKAVVASSPVPK